MASEWKIMSTTDAIPEGYERRMRIVQALSELFETQPIEAVTISSICERAGISKPTFYRYFSDKYEAVNWYHFVYSTRVLYQVGRTLTWHEATVKMFEHVAEERTFYERAFLQPEGFESLAAFNEQTNTEQQVAALRENGVEVTPRLLFQIEFWIRAVNAAIKRWVSSGFDMTPEEFADHLDNCRPHELQEAMDAPVLARRRCGRN